MINNIKYVTLNAEYNYTIIKCCTKVLANRNLTMWGVLIIDKRYSSSHHPLLSSLFMHCSYALVITLFALFTIHAL